MQVDKEWSEFYANLKRATGLDLNLYKQDQLQRRLRSMMESRGISGINELSRKVSSDPEEAVTLIDRLAINVSELYRNPEKWEEIEKTVIPDLLSRSKKLTCWSAGCSFGAEAHTLACLLEEKFSGSHTIEGTDIDLTALAQAKRGEFSEADMRGVPLNIRNRYFDLKNGKWVAKDSIRRYLSFKRGDLLAETFKDGYDLILCRNVVIYFTDEAKSVLYEKFYRALKPGGVLFVGSTERIFQSRQIGFESPLPFFYKKPLEIESKWRNAS